MTMSPILLAAFTISGIVAFVMTGLKSKESQSIHGVEAIQKDGCSWKAVAENRYCGGEFGVVRRSLGRHHSVEKCQSIAEKTSDCQRFIYSDGNECRCVDKDHTCIFEDSMSGAIVYEWVCPGEEGFFVEDHSREHGTSFWALGAAGASCDETCASKDRECSKMGMIESNRRVDTESKALSVMETVLGGKCPAIRGSDSLSCAGLSVKLTDGSCYFTPEARRHHPVTSSIARQQIRT